MVFDAAKDICYGFTTNNTWYKVRPNEGTCYQIAQPSLLSMFRTTTEGVCSYLAAENYSNVTVQSTEGVSIFVMGDMNPESDPSIAHDITSGSSLKMTNVIKINEYAPQSEGGMTGDMFILKKLRESDNAHNLFYNNIKFPFDYEPSAVPYIITLDKNNNVTIKNEFDEKQSIDPLNLPLNNYVFYIDHQDLSETIIEREDDTTYIKQCIIYNADSSELSDDVDSEILTENSVKYYINSNKVTRGKYKSLGILPNHEKTIRLQLLKKDILYLGLGGKQVKININ